MFLLKLRNKIKYTFIQHMKKTILIGLAVISVSLLIASGTISDRLDIHRFDNMARADMIYDFQYLMTALEDSWPFFNLSVSANNVDVHALADNVHALLSDPATVLDSPFDFLDIIAEHFFTPINQLGHLRPIMCYESFFASQAHVRREIRRGATSRTAAYHYELFHRPETVMFYSRMRDAGRGAHRPQAADGPVMTFDSIEEGRTAYMSVNRMINVWDDMPSPFAGMWQYELRAFNFTRRIQGYEHLIIDFRGNPGGRTLHFNSFILPMFLHEGMQLQAYVHYMSGAYANLAREVFDIRDMYPVWLQYGMEDPMSTRVFFNEPLPYLDAQIDFAYTFESVMSSGAGQYFYGYFASARQEVLFNGKIWLLTDERTGSSAESMAAMLKYNNIATLVGAPTFGVMGTNYEATTINMSLPNTGIIVRFDVAYYTDRYGRPLQGYGIQPHYLNRPGMDALETVLAMIEEGSY